MEMMARPVGRHWWALLIRGIVAIVFGIMALVWPGITLIVLVSLFGAFALVDGIFSVVAAIGEREHDNWGWLLVGGLIGIIIGIITFFWPHITLLILLNIIAIWAILTGIYDFVIAFAYHQPAGREVLLIIGGVISLIFAAILLFHPVSAVLGIIWVIGVYAIVLGILWIVRAFRFRSLTQA